MKKGSGTFFVYKRFYGGSMQNGKQERVKAGYHHSGGALPFILSICQKVFVKNRIQSIYFFCAVCYNDAY